MVLGVIGCGIRDALGSTPAELGAHRRSDNHVQRSVKSHGEHWQCYTWEEAEEEEFLRQRSHLLAWKKCDHFAVLQLPFLPARGVREAALDRAAISRLPGSTAPEENRQGAASRDAACHERVPSDHIDRSRKMSHRAVSWTQSC